MEMHLLASRDMEVTIGDNRVSFVAGETIHTESSRKFTEDTIRELATTAGWTVTAFETGEAPSVALALLGT